MLPILDIKEYLNDPGAEHARKFVQDLRETCHGPGFFYLKGHGVDQDSNAQILETANQFFELPLADREALSIGQSPHFRGYTLLKSERTAGQIDWRDQIDIGPEEAALSLGSGDPPWLRLRGPNQWPTGLPLMKETVDHWMQQMHPLGMALMRAIAEGLGKPAHYFDDRMSPDAYTRVKIIRYPSQPESQENAQGLGLHHDSGVLTMILQDAVPGLQVMSNGKLLDVEPIKDTFVVNLGEMMQSATSGYLRATKHQVVSPPPGKQRISIAYFMNPRLDARFEPVALPTQFQKEAPGGQNDDPRDPVFSTFGANTLKIRMRSHPDVTAAFYSDVKLENLE
ncbi:MAG: hypothetical protein KTR18_05615 [Acidiferrobacterales bacterium]|nr:hypothetical protein [Acidiferrobacterales bacterium]